MDADLVVGITPLGHDLSVTIARRDGTVLLVAEEERYSRCKGGEFVFLPSRLETILAEIGVAPSNVFLLAPAGNPAATEATQTYPPAAREAHLQAWLNQYRDTFRNAEVRPPLRHHRAHAASSYFPSSFDAAAVITIDGHGDGECCTISIGRGNAIDLLDRQIAPHSVTYLYRVVATYLGLRGHEREGKLMALAAFGRPRLARELATLFFDRIEHPAVAADRVCAVPCRTDVWLQLLVERFGEPRKPSAPMTERDVDLAASAQEIFKRHVMSVLRHARTLTGVERACVAGGAFVNSVVNGYALSHGPFRHLFLPAWAGDCGLSIGAAAAALADRGVRLRLPNAYFGSSLDLDEVPDLARRRGLTCVAVEDPPRRAAEAVEAGRIVGWAQGRLEVGPRALGNRSILAYAAEPHIRHELNRRKGRESWRPFGVSVLAGELDPQASAPFMNITVADRRPSFASAVHVDGSCRVHTVSDEENPTFAALLREMKQRTGTGVVINTSLNGPRQPIARTATECLDTYIVLDLDALFIGNYLITGRPRRAAEVESRADSSLAGRFELLVPYSDGSRLLAELQARAVRSVLRPDLLVAGKRPAPSQYDLDVVIYIAWYNAVLHETLPRVAAWALEQRARGTRVTIIDKSGAALKVTPAMECHSSDELYSQPPTDVEGHFLRRIARSKHVYVPESPWFPVSA